MSSSLIYELTSIVDRLDFAKLFPRQQPVEVELGCGDSTFIVEYAARHPERNFIGVERLLGRLRKLDRKGSRLGLTNLRGIRIESAYFLEFLLPPESICALHVYFPDPWPKRKHQHKRLVNERFVELARRALVPGGAVYLRTDNSDYHTQMTTVFGNSAAFRAIETPPELRAFLTDFERDFLAKGVQTLYAAYQRVG
ncbi:MAG: tRNA (guanosine(46)-N7)-methyltransferase TrmB [Verrucomicrobiae bacterium]|nr:tRNA (guanosine(46)-N7)-methyltransferase TrmB [Verrucomicrobiae bacterium]MCX7721551.1 tRNA (guanosine(46)-N7)-methyltransferase TrmB [Verrucomicrobiae bacterium]MDW7979582.1 tRNA (guanosine(46)-N7)-methyltransferase TrmB [Verrucomicrobiales bacterium]